jgi:hypothetical protein
MDHRKFEKVAYQFGIQNFQSFGQFKAQKLRSILPLLCRETEFCSDVNRQNSVTPKPFSGQRRMGNG